jgi:hypothetical protein
VIHESSLQKYETAYKNPNCHSAAGEESPAFMNLSPDVLVIIMGFGKEIIWTYVNSWQRN